MAKVREPFAIFKSLVALTLIILCLIAAQWQYQRGVDRHARNAIIEKHIALAPTSLDSVKDSPLAAEWQTVTTQGVFDPTKQILRKIAIAKVSMALKFSHCLQLPTMKNSG